MKIHKILIMTGCLHAAFFSSIQAQYTVSANINWSVLTSNKTICNHCTFTIVTGATLTLNTNGVTCVGCSFTGGNIAVTHDYICQDCSFKNDSLTMAGKTLSLSTTSSGTAYFSGTYFGLTGSSQIDVTSAVSISNSSFVFNNTSNFLNAGGAFTMSASNFLFYDNAYFDANIGPVNIENHSEILAGNGTLSSKAYIKMEMGNNLNIYDNSIISLAGYNNYFYDWGTYNSIANGMVYTPYTKVINCGSGFPNACAQPLMYGCATLNSAGPVKCTPLPVIATNLSATVRPGNTVDLSWSVQQDNKPAGFGVERSADGKNFEAMGAAIPKDADGSVARYVFTDDDPVKGAGYYRLKIVEQDGGIDYSGTVMVEVDKAESTMGLFPNPVVGHVFNFRTPSTDPLLLKVFSISGQELWLGTLKGQTLYRINLPAGIPDNTYLVVQSIGSNKTQSFLVLNK